MSDPWRDLRRFTSARIALGRAGGSLPTAPLLEFRLAHARAKDAVMEPFDGEELARRLEGLGQELCLLDTRAADRTSYLLRPDWGRRLAEHSCEELRRRAAAPADLAIVLSDGLSARAVMEQSPKLLERLLPLLRADGWSLAPLCLVRHGRVAVQDEIGEMLGAELCLMLLGERPGLGSPDSLGAYFTYGPRLGRTDAERNCVSNIRPEGLSPAAAARSLHRLLSASRQRKLSGIGLKDESPLLPGGEIALEAVPEN